MQNFLGALQTPDFAGNYIAIDQQKRRNVLAERDQQLQEQNAGMNRNYLAAQMDNLQRDDARAVEAAKQARLKEWAGSRIAHVRQNPALIPRVVAEGKQLGFLPPEIPENIGPDQVEEFAMQLGIPPQQKLETIGDMSNPADGLWQRNPITGETKQVTAPHYESNNGLRAPSGYMFTPEGTLAPIPGGPADPNNPKNDRADLKQVQSLRKEFEGLDSVKKYQETLPLLISARKAPNNGYGDLQLIYTAGKVLDPGSVVREGELALTVAAGSPLQRILGKTQFTIEKGGRLTPKVRQQILGMLNERVMAYRQGYDRDYTRYADYGSKSGFVPQDVVGKHAANAYRQSAPPAAEVTATGPNGQKIVLRNGQWVTAGG